MKPLSIYIHIPFCVKKCDYCDFLSAPADRSVQEQYFHALKKEMEARAGLYKAWEAQTVFIGGGTPSILPPAWIEELLACLRGSFHLACQAEISMEMNPGTGQTEADFRTYRQAGINRLSIGLQSASARELTLLGRIHTWEEFLNAFQCARESGFANLNVDVMSALPGQTRESYAETLHKVCMLKPEHISAYSLIIEEGTPFFERYKGLAESEEGEEKDRELYLLTKEVLKGYGYHRYEISNYAKKGWECRHNLVYWTRGDYLGLGIGAASMIQNIRFKNTPQLEEYLKKEGQTEAVDTEILSRQEQMAEFMFLGLRLTKGVSCREFERLFGCSMDSMYGEVLSKNQADGLLVWGERVCLTPRGLDLSNYVMAQFL